MVRQGIAALAATACLLGAGAASAGTFSGLGVPADYITGGTVLDFESYPADVFPTDPTDTSASGIDPRDGAATSFSYGGVTFSGFDTTKSATSTVDSAIYVTDQVTRTQAQSAAASTEFDLYPYQGTETFNMSGNFLTNWEKFSATASGTQVVFQDEHTSQFRFDFEDTVSAFGFNFGGPDAVWTLSAYTADGTLVDEMDIGWVAVDEISDGQYYGITGANISYALLTYSHNTYDGYCYPEYYAFVGQACGDWVLIDNLTYASESVGAVPVPAAAPLMAGGLLSFLFLRRRKA